MLVIKNTPTADALRASQSMAQSLTGIANTLHRRGAYGADVKNALYDEEKAKKLEEYRKKQEKAHEELGELDPMTRATAAAMKEMEKSFDGFGLESGLSMREEYDKDYQKGLDRGKGSGYWYGTDAKKAHGELEEMTADLAPRDIRVHDKKEKERKAKEEEHQRKLGEAVDIAQRKVEEDEGFGYREGEEAITTAENAFKLDAHKRMEEEGGYGVGLNEEANRGRYGPKAEKKRKEMERKFPPLTSVQEKGEKEPKFAKQYKQLEDRYKKIEETGELQEKAKKFSKETKKLRKMAEIHPEIIPGESREDQYSYVYEQFNKSMENANTTDEKLDAWAKGYANMKNLDRYWEKDDADSFFSDAKLKLYLGDKKKKGGRRRSVDRQTYAVKGYGEEGITSRTLQLNEGFNGATLMDKASKHLSEEEMKDPEKLADALDKIGTHDSTDIASALRRGVIMPSQVSKLSRHNPGEGESHSLKENEALRKDLQENEHNPRGQIKALKARGVSVKAYLKQNPESIPGFADAGAFGHDYEAFLTFMHRYGTEKQRAQAKEIMKTMIKHGEKSDQ